MIGGNYVRGIGNNDKYDASIASVSLNIKDSSIAENLIGGGKIVAYGSSEAKSDIQSINLTVDNSKVEIATVVGNMLKSSGMDVAGFGVKEATVNIKNGSDLNGLILGGVAAYMSRDNTPGANTESKVGKVTATIDNSTIHKLGNGGISGLNHVFGDAAILMGGVSSNATTLEVTGSATTDSIKLSLKQATVEGDIYMGGYTNDSACDAAVKESTLLLGENTEIKGTIYSQGINTVVPSEEEKPTATIVFDSKTVNVEGGITGLNKKSTLAGTGNFNDGFESPEAALASLLSNVNDDTDASSVYTVIDQGMNNGSITQTTDGTITKHVNTIQENTMELTSGTILSMDRILANDLRKRMGDLRSSSTQHGVWARYDGGRLSGSNNLENDFNTIQIGIDTIPVVGAPHMGVAFSYTKTDADFFKGSAETDAFSLAAYGTWFADNGLFADVIGRVATVDTEMNVVGAQKTGKLNNIMLSLSGEVGYRLDLSPLVYVEPSAELTYAYINDETVEFGNATYEINDTDSLIARVGFAIGMKCPADKGDLYARVAAAHQFLGDSKLTPVGYQALEADGSDTWVEFGLGGQWNINKATYVWADVERTEGAMIEEDWRATVGVRYNF